MPNTHVSNNGMNEAGVYNEGLLPGRSPMVGTRGPCSHQGTVQNKWLAKDNTCVMTCYYPSQQGVRGYRQRLHAF